ncbi:MAG: rhodanese-like domain-containing protein [Sphingobacteriales bacterium]|jgi:rhodanese-related sulfurtransferase|nr:rhodanese-like domain-containing protein [Sphingobacteriales bacterium]
MGLKFLKNLSALGIVITFSINAFSQNEYLLSANKFVETIALDSNSIVLDVRTKVEFNNGHIARAINVNIFDTAFKKEVQKLDKKKNIYIYCQSGRRSARAIDFLKSLGYEHLYELNGGISDWKKENLPIEIIKDEGSAVLSRKDN